MNGSRGFCHVGSVNIMTKGDDVLAKNGLIVDKMAASENGEGDRSSAARVARECAYDLIHHVTGVKTAKLKPANSKYAKTLRRTVDEISEKHRIFLESAVRKLDITEESARTTIDNVANEMFVDKHFNWGRLVTLYSFCARVAKYCADKYTNDRTNLVEKIADYTAEYVADILSTWIQQHGGWDAFVDYFPEPVNLENAVWKGLLYTVVGLGALATMVAAR